MNREIKFRAFLKKDNKMYEVITLMKGFNDEEGYRVYVNKHLNYGDPTNYLCDGENATLMQYTGLKDKNGKEIYEGDILKDVLIKTEMKVCFGFNKYAAYTGWYCEYLNINTNKFAGLNNDDDSDRNSNIEVIGNIHQNPDLLI